MPVKITDIYKGTNEDFACMCKEKESMQIDRRNC